MFQKLKSLYYKNQYQKQLQNISDTYEFIWGLSNDTNEADLFTMNNIDIVYNKKEKTYSIEIETGYLFTNGKTGEKTYIKNLFNKLTEWMIHKGYDINQEITLDEMFTQGKNINSEFETIEELYAVFKCLVFGFCEG